MMPGRVPRARDAFADRAPVDPGALARARSRTWATVDLDALASNLAALRLRVPDATQVMAVVKADAYGHGMVPVAQAVLAAGGTWFGVATADEALVLRSAAPEAQILVMGPAGVEWLGALADAGCAIAIGDRAGIQAVATRPTQFPLRVHLKVDTGMTRFGVAPDDVGDVARALAGAGAIVEGIFTHLAAADDPDPSMTRAQLAAFERAAAAARRVVPKVIGHAAASAAVFAHAAAAFDMIRVGMALYGVSSVAHVHAGLRPVMAVRSRVARVQGVGAGTPVSYGPTYRTAAATRIATVPIGYGDGYPRALGNAGVMLAGGRRVPVVGSVCMDYTMLDVQDAAVREGEEVTVFGGALPVSEVAAAAATIPYEIVTRIGPRVPRLYLRGGRTTAWSTVARSVYAVHDGGGEVGG
jgi:alanine racemase